MGSAAELLGWWGVLTGLWVVVSGLVAGWDVAIGAAVALFGAVLARWFRRLLGYSLRGKVPVRWVGAFVVRLAAETLALAGWLKGRRRLRASLALSRLRHRGPLSVAAATLLCSATPGTVVCDETTESRRVVLVVHRLSLPRRTFCRGVVGDAGHVARWVNR